jgi:predicted nucleic acid-binding protein
MVTTDTNIAFYALAIESNKAERAADVLEESDFLSVQVLNEYASSVRRKLHREWGEIERDLYLLRNSVAEVLPIDDSASQQAMRLASRYELSFYDALMIAVALANGATILYSEDMHHGLVIDGKLTITNPFLPAEPQ